MKPTPYISQPLHCYQQGSIPTWSYEGKGASEGTSLDVIDWAEKGVWGGGWSFVGDVWRLVVSWYLGRKEVAGEVCITCALNRSSTQCEYKKLNIIVPR